MKNVDGILDPDYVLTTNEEKNLFKKKKKNKHSIFQSPLLASQRNLHVCKYEAMRNAQ